MNVHMICFRLFCLHVSYTLQASFVGCTAPDPQDFEDECPTIGEPCPQGNAGEFCCRDACPRNYCTAKQAPAVKKSGFLSDLLTE